jgi:hypothetical protein
LVRQNQNWMVQTRRIDANLVVASVRTIFSDAGRRGSTLIDGFAAILPLIWRHPFALISWTIVNRLQLLRTDERLTDGRVLFKMNAQVAPSALRASQKFRRCNSAYGAGA